MAMFHCANCHSPVLSACRLTHVPRPVASSRGGLGWWTCPPHTFLPVFEIDANPMSFYGGREGGRSLFEFNSPICKMRRTRRIFCFRWTPKAEMFLTSGGGGFASDLLDLEIGSSQNPLLVRAPHSPCVSSPPHIFSPGHAPDHVTSAPSLYTSFLHAVVWRLVFSTAPDFPWCP